MKSKNTRRIILLIIVFMLSLNVVQAYANKANDLKKDKSNIQQQIKDTQKEIKDIQNQSKDVSKQIDKLDGKVNEANMELEKIEEELDAIKEDIDKNEEELEEAEKNLEERQELFNSRLRVMYMNGNVGYLELLLSSSNIRDFLSRKDMIQSIASNDDELVKYMEEQRDIIDEKKVELRAQRASVEATRSKLKSRKEDLAKATREKEIFMGRLEKDKTNLDKTYAQLEKDSKSIEAEIKRLQQASKPKPKPSTPNNASKGGNSNSSGSSGATNNSGGSNNPGNSSGKMAWPVPGHSRITSYYGWRPHPVTGGNKKHTGIDIGAPTGASIVAARSGVVILSQSYYSYGNTIIIDHGGGISTLYAHNSSLVVGVGTRVNKGDVIAKAGSTGVSTGPHCHFEVRKNGVDVDPIPWLR